MKRRRNSQAIPEEIQTFLKSRNINYIIQGISLASSLEEEMDFDGDTLIQWMIKESVLPNNVDAMSTPLQRKTFLLLLEYFPNAKYFQSVKELDLPSIDLYQIPDEIVNLKNLEKLNLTNNPLSELPKSIGNLTNLTKLYLHNNNLSELPKSIGNLKKLVHLGLAQNNLTKLPKSIGNLMNLEWFTIYENDLTKLPKSIGNLKNLRSLYLFDNNLTKLPKSIGNLNYFLEMLNLNNNNLSPSEKQRIEQLLPYTYIEF